MATAGRDIKDIELAQQGIWRDGPPYELFKQMRGQCPIHWTDGFEQYPEEAGFWSVTSAEDVHAVSRDWQTYSSELGGVTAFAEPLFSGPTAAITVGSPSNVSSSCERVRACSKAGHIMRIGTS